MNSDGRRWPVLAARRTRSRRGPRGRLRAGRPRGRPRAWRRWSSTADPRGLCTTQHPFAGAICPSLTASPSVRRSSRRRRTSAARVTVRRSLTELPDGVPDQVGPAHDDEGDHRRVGDQPGQVRRLLAASQVRPDGTGSNPAAATLPRPRATSPSAHHLHHPRQPPRPCGIDSEQPRQQTRTAEHQQSQCHPSPGEGNDHPVRR